MIAMGSAKKRKSKIISLLRFCLLASRQAIKTPSKTPNPIIMSTPEYF
jgi:hypothetical protein